VSKAALARWRDCFVTSGDRTETMLTARPCIANALLHQSLVHDIRDIEQTQVRGTSVIAVVLPCYKSKPHVLDVIARIGPETSLIVAVDDACPMETGAHIEEHCRDPRVSVVRNETNLGVGGAVMHGYRVALAKGADVVVKIDSDGQMDPGFLPNIVRPILEGIADYSKGNRFFSIEDVQSMPKIRVLGNAGLSFLTKLSSGYWSIFDPTNGYTAIHRVALELLPLGKIDQRFFFESDMLFRLNLAGAVVVDIPMRAIYADETSTLKIRRVFFAFLGKNLRNLGKRIFYRYFLRDLNLGSIELVVGTLLLAFGTIFGATQWIAAVSAGEPATAGTVMLSGLPVLVGIQLLLGFFSFDITSVPRIPLTRLLGSQRKADGSDAFSELPPIS
jgi:glycosyltransferase involved in cell wall biosynthesis